MDNLVTKAKYTQIDDLNDIDDYADTPTNWVQPGMLAEGAITLLVGHSGHGKTNVTLKICDASAREQEFLGHKHKARKVLYLDKDMNPVSSLKARQKWLGIKLGGNLKYCGLNDPNDVPPPDAAHILEWVSKQELPPIVVIDSLIRFLGPGRNENSSSDIAWFWAQIVKLKKLNCPVLVLHHTGKGDSTNQGRGSSDIEAGCDIMFIVKKTGGGHKNLTQVTMQNIPRRYRYDPLPEYTVIDISDSGVFTTDTPPETTEITNAGLRSILELYPGISGTKFAQEAIKLGGMNTKLAARFLKDRIKEGSITTEKGEKNSTLHTLAVNFKPVETKVTVEAGPVIPERESIEVRMAHLKARFAADAWDYSLDEDDAPDNPTVEAHELDHDEPDNPAVAAHELDVWIH